MFVRSHSSNASSRLIAMDAARPPTTVVEFLRRAFLESDDAQLGLGRVRDDVIDARLQQQPLVVVEFKYLVCQGLRCLDPSCCSRVGCATLMAESWGRDHSEADGDHPRDVVVALNVAFTTRALCYCWRSALLAELQPTIGVALHRIADDVTVHADLCSVVPSHTDADSTTSTTWRSSVHSDWRFVLRALRLQQEKGEHPRSLRVRIL